MLHSGMNISSEYQTVHFDIPAVEKDLSMFKDLLHNHLESETAKLKSAGKYTIDDIRKYDEEVYFLRVIDFLKQPEIYSTKLGHKEIYNLAVFMNSIFGDIIPMNHNKPTL